MNVRKSSLGFSILAGGLSFVGSANAVDLISNGSFEGDPPTGWQFFSAYNFSSAYFTGPAIPASENPGARYGWRPATANGDWANFVTPTNEVDHLQYNLQFAATQSAALTNAMTGAVIDAGLGRYTFSAWLASYGQPGANPEQPYVVLRFFDDAGATQMGTNVVFDRSSNVNAVSYASGFPNNPPLPGPLLDHGWIKYLAAGNVPAGARKAMVYLTRSPNAGLSGTPDTYMDLIKLDVSSDTVLPVSISVVREGDNIVVRWTGGGPLESADQITGPWSVVIGATSPYTVPNPTANKFFRPMTMSSPPISISVAREGSNVVIRWTGGVPLESAVAVAGPWSLVSGATSPYTVPNPTGNRFFRPKIP
jgi:hypothetical protein